MSADNLSEDVLCRFVGGPLDGCVFTMAELDSGTFSAPPGYVGEITGDLARYECVRSHIEATWEFRP